MLLEPCVVLRGQQSSILLAFPQSHAHKREVFTTDVYLSDKLLLLLPAMPPVLIIFPFYYSLLCFQRLAVFQVPLFGNNDSCTCCNLFSCSPAGCLSPPCFSDLDSSSACLSVCLSALCSCASVSDSMSGTWPFCQCDI